MPIEITLINKLSANVIDEMNKIILINDNNDNNKDSKILDNYATSL